MQPMPSWCKRELSWQEKAIFEWLDAQGSGNNHILAMLANAYEEYVLALEQIAKTLV